MRTDGQTDVVSDMCRLLAILPTVRDNGRDPSMNAADFGCYAEALPTSCTSMCIQGISGIKL
jgi:hypothetical protein